MPPLGKARIPFFVRIVGAAVLAATTPLPAFAQGEQHEVVVKLLIVHRQINSNAAPLAAEEVARTHAKLITDPQIARRATTDFLILNAKNPALPVDEKALPSIVATGRPSTEFGAVSVVELRVRSKIAEHATNMAEAVTDEYARFLDSRIFNSPEMIPKMKSALSKVKIDREIVRGVVTPEQLAMFDSTIRELEFVLESTKLMNRVGVFEIIELERSRPRNMAAKP